MAEVYRKKTKTRTVLVLTADEFSPKKKGYVVYEKKSGEYFGNPFGVIWKSKKDAIEQAKLRTKVRSVS